MFLSLQHLLMTWMNENIYSYKNRTVSVRRSLWSGKTKQRSSIVITTGNVYVLADDL